LQTAFSKITQFTGLIRQGLALTGTKVKRVWNHSPRVGKHDVCRQEGRTSASSTLH